MLNAYMLSDVMLNREHSSDIYVLNVVMLSYIVLSVNMLNVVMLSVIILSVEAPLFPFQTELQKNVFANGSIKRATYSVDNELEKSVNPTGKG
jgi:hypothetical protein